MREVGWMGENDCIVGIFDVTFDIPGGARESIPHPI